MGKKKEFKIKTSKYFTRTCSNCGKEIPSWYVSCPFCKTPWDQEKYEKEREKGAELKKDVKMVVKVTEENFTEPIKNVFLKFSPNNGQSWYEIKMEEKSDDIFEAEILEIPEETTLIYYIEVELTNKERVIENNKGKYYKYKISSSETENNE